MSLPTFLGSGGSLPDAVIWSDLAVPEDGDGGVVTRIYGFSGEKKNISFIFPPPRNKTLHVLICSVNLAIHQL
jgi:hypothetical protein